MVVIGVDPDADLELFEGERRASGWIRTNATAAASVGSKNGFVVIQLAARTGEQSYAVWSVQPPVAHAPTWTANPGAPVPVFRAVGGQVTFVGGLSLEAVQGGLSFKVDDSPALRAAAARFMAATYPQLPPATATETMQLVPSAAGREAEAPPHDASLSGFVLGVWAGPVSLKGPAAARADAGGGYMLGFDLGFIFGGHIPLTFSLGRVILDDNKPFSQVVVDCTMLNGVTTGCGDSHSESSSIFATTLSLETGFQHRFRPWQTVSILPAVFVGYLWNPTGISREIGGCDDCKSIPIDGIRVQGAYAGPSLRLILGKFFALALRTEIPLGGDLGVRTLFGAELGGY